MNFNKLQSSQSSKYSKKSLVKSSALLLSFLSIFGCATIKHAQEDDFTFTITKETLLMRLRILNNDFPDWHSESG